MDRYCIRRGTLLDAPSVETLRHPALHSVHCLVDVPRCVNSPFFLLQPEANEAGLHNVAFQLSAEGKQMAIAQARSLGRCTTCANTGSLGQGYRTTVIGNFTEPDILAPTRPLVYDQSCEELGLEQANVRALNITTPPIDYESRRNIHGSCMLISWGLLIPCGILIAHLMKHRKPTWYKFHRGIQVLGIVLALIGWLTSLMSFDVFSGENNTSKTHGILGCVVMSLGLFQPLNAILRPHIEDGEKETHARRLWKHIHKSTGYTAFILAIPNIAIGTSIIPNGLPYQIAYGVCWGILLMVAYFLHYDKIEFMGSKGAADTSVAVDAPHLERVTFSLHLFYC